MCTFFIFGLSAIHPRDAVRPRPVRTYLCPLFQKSQILCALMNVDICHGMALHLPFKVKEVQILHIPCWTWALQNTFILLPFLFSNEILHITKGGLPQLNLI